MPSEKIPQPDAYALMMKLGAPERAARYRQEAARFRHMAETESDNLLRQSLLDIAKEYEDLADGLVPRQHDGA
jgi:hypothetical protein